MDENEETVIISREQKHWESIGITTPAQLKVLESSVLFDYFSCDDEEEEDNVVKE
jgi:hypothetical protein